MAEPTTTQALVASIANQLEDHGVRDFVIALRDPDGLCDEVRVGGSPFWWLGLGLNLQEHGKDLVDVTTSFDDGDRPEDDDEDPV